MLLLAVGIGCLVGCGRTINRTAERRIRDVLPDLLGPARAYRVHVDNDPERTLRGRLARVTIDGDDVTLKNGLILDSLHLELTGVDVDTAAGRVRDIKATKFTATVGDANINDYLVGETFQGEKIRNVRVKCRPGGVTISAERQMVQVSPPIIGGSVSLFVPFQLTGPVHLTGPRQMALDAQQLDVVGIPITGTPLEFLMKRFDSGFDLNVLPFPVTLTDAQTTEGQIVLTGTADVSSIIKSSRNTMK